MSLNEYVILPSPVDGLPVRVPVHDVVDRISEIRFLSRARDAAFEKWKKEMQYE
jgi:hypothetical protein